MNHQDLIDEIAELCDCHNVLYYYIPDSRKVQGRRGFPDIAMVGSFHTMFREIKVGEDKLSPDQVVWKYSLYAAGQDVDIWRERDLDSGRIEDEIASLNER
jgi:hypothetical protein